MHTYIRTYILTNIHIIIYISISLISDIDKIHSGIGDKFAILVQWVATFFAGFAIGFSRDWRLTLFLIAVTPLLAIAAAGFSKVSKF